MNVCAQRFMMLVKNGSDEGASAVIKAATATNLAPVLVQNVNLGDLSIGTYTRVF